MAKMYGFLIVLMTWTTAVYAATCLTNGIATTPTTSFSINGDGTVVDNRTKLMWKRCAEGTVFNNNGTAENAFDDSCDGVPAEITWQQALEQVVTVNNGGFASAHDWRLPNVKELASIIELQCHHPAFNETLFLSVAGPNAYWSSSQDASNAARAWVLHTIYGSDSRQYKGSYLAGALLVRNVQ